MNLKKRLFPTKCSIKMRATFMELNFLPSSDENNDGIEPSIQN